MKCGPKASVSGVMQNVIPSNARDSLPAAVILVVQGRMTK